MKNNFYSARAEDMRKLRFEQGFTMQAIGDKYGLSRERVRQILGITGGYITNLRKREAIKSAFDDGKSVQDIAQETNSCKITVRRVLSGKRFEIHGETNRARGKRIEDWVSRLLDGQGVKNKNMTNSHGYDIETESGKRLEVTAAFSAMCPPSLIKISPTSSGFYNFKTSRGRNADFLILVLAETEPYRVLIIPYSEIKVDYIRFPNGGKSKWEKYENRFDLL
jgi:hypothetical protein